MDYIWIRQAGDAVAVDTNYMRQIYIAHPEPGMESPQIRAETYLRAVLSTNARKGIPMQRKQSQS